MDSDSSCSPLAEKRTRMTEPRDLASLMPRVGVSLGGGPAWARRDPAGRWSTKAILWARPSSHYW